MFQEGATIAERDAADEEVPETQETGGLETPTASRSGNSSAHRMPFGAEVERDGRIRFRLWAPAAETVRVVLTGGDAALLMQPAGDGWHELLTAEASVGSRYQFVLPGGQHVPDPASRYQPEDAHGPSEIVDPTEYTWHDTTWKGRPWNEAILYELHVGAFTQEGTFRAVIEKLDYLAELGVSGIEIMPIGDFPGKRNWGYDGVLPYAPDSSYGRPEDLKALVDAAHARGLMVVLDVVYNHFGPDGNYLPSYAPQIFTDRHKTGWGEAVNYDSEGSEVVRDFVIHNALYWLEEFHMDGLRLDAVHAIKDDSSKHLLEELAERVGESAGDRAVHLILENEDNEAKRLHRDEHGEPALYTAQWNDDVHHVLHTAATAEDGGYYKDFNGDTEKLGRALAEGFAFQGEYMEHRGSPRGERSGFLPPTAFVSCIQNHDQVGNRARGERIGELARPEALHAIAVVYLLLPQTPMLFMGEEWGTTQPFPFFCDFDGELAESIRKGRREEFACFHESAGTEGSRCIPDPLAEETFLSAKLDWCARTEETHAQWLEWYKRVLRVRKEKIIPLLKEIGGHAGSYEVVGPEAVVVSWNVNGGCCLKLAANLSNVSVDGFPACKGEVLWQEGPPPLRDRYRPWSVRWTLEGTQ